MVLRQQKTALLGTTMAQTIDDLVGWADEEGGPLSLFYCKCVSLDGSLIRNVF